MYFTAGNFNGDYDDDFNGTRRPKFGLGLSRDVSRAVLLNSYPAILITIIITVSISISIIVVKVIIIVIIGPGRASAGWA